ncbi:MAG: hypothetical protein GC154_10225 [bacterium]|nr:hypothetical protein [bacterium]
MTERWLMIRNGAVGDTILLSVLIQAIRAARPDTEVDVMGVLERVELLIGENLARAACDAERIRLDTLYGGGPLHPDAQSFFAGYSHVLFFTANPDSALESKLRARPDQWVRAYPALPPPGYAHHASRHYLGAVADCIAVGRTPNPVIQLTDRERAEAADELRARGLTGAPIAVVHPGAGSRAKLAPLDEFERELDRRPHAGLLIVEGPADADSVSAFTSRLPAETTRWVVRGRRLRSLAALLSHGGRFIGNDSGPAHLAAALGLPVTVFFIASDPRVWAPLGPLVEVRRLEVEPSA